MFSSLLYLVDSFAPPTEVRVTSEAVMSNPTPLLPRRSHTMALSSDTFLVANSNSRVFPVESASVDNGATLISMDAPSEISRRLFTQPDILFHENPLNVVL